MNFKAQIPYKYVQVLCTIGNTCACKLDSSLEKKFVRKNR